MGEKKIFERDLEQHTRAVEQFTLDFLRLQLGGQFGISKMNEDHRFTTLCLIVPDLLITSHDSSRQIFIEITTSALEKRSGQLFPKQPERRLFEAISYQGLGGLIIYQQHVAKSSGFLLLKEVVSKYMAGLPHEKAQDLLDNFALENSGNKRPANEVDWIEHMKKMSNYFGMT